MRTLNFQKQNKILEHIFQGANIAHIFLRPLHSCAINHVIPARKKDKTKKEQSSECGLFVLGIRQHNQIMHGKEELRPYQCEVCENGLFRKVP